ncbi:MAG: hypothetical protein C0412_15715 [Flavobacterium sp.]|nr:hypothetical protein [Flavobacterium sp.]
MIFINIYKNFMKSFPKILIIFFLTVFILQIICLFFLFLAPVASHATDIKFTPQVGIGEDFIAGTQYPVSGSTKTIAEYIRVIYKYAIGVVGILAAVVLMIGGVLWVVAGGNATTIGEAKAWIGASLTGLVLALTSYLILATINPALVKLETTSIPSVSEIKGTNYSADNTCEWAKIKTNQHCEDVLGIGWIDSDSKTKCGGEETFERICCCKKTEFQQKCGQTPADQTICRYKCMTEYGETNYSANCDSEKICCKKINYRYCRNNGEGLCFECGKVLGLYDCFTMYCSGGYKRERSLDSFCPENNYCCVQEK